MTVSRDEANQCVKVVNRSSLPIFDVEIEELTLRAAPTARWRPDAGSTAAAVAPDGELEVSVEFIKADGDVWREMIDQLDVASEQEISFDAQIKVHRRSRSPMAASQREQTDASLHIGHRRH
ncbi:hypothetical protein GS966_19895 [Rhodococcus hoagii]|nr:hypothetical protein [Prescottella equi]NKZ92189.1 hypothetical protein [Prescottella equi]